MSIHNEVHSELRINLPFLLGRREEEFEKSFQQSSGGADSRNESGDDSAVYSWAAWNLQLPFEKGNLRRAAAARLAQATQHTSCGACSAEQFPSEILK